VKQQQQKLNLLKQKRKQQLAEVGWCAQLKPGVYALVVILSIV
jgi:hypothetical protein